MSWGIPVSMAAVIRCATSSARARLLVTLLALAIAGWLAPAASAVPLHIVKTASVSNVTPGDVVEYTVDVTNPQSGAAGTVDVRDAIPTGLTYVPGSLGVSVDDVPLPIGAVTGDTITVAHNTLQTGSKIRIVYRTTVDASAPAGAIDNVVSVEWTDSGVRNSRTSGPATITVTIPPPDVSIAKAVTDLNGGAVHPGDVLRYTVTTTNAGSPVTAASVSDALPAGVSYVAGSLTSNGSALTDTGGDDAGQVSGGTVTVSIGTLGRNATSTVTFDARVDADVVDGHVIGNAASVTSTFDGTASTLTSAPARVTVAAPGALTVQKTVADSDAGDVLRYDLLAYTVTVTSTGVGYARDVTLTDPIPAGTSYVPGSAAVDGVPLTDAAGDDAVDASAAGVTARLGAMAPGTSRTVTFHVRVAINAANGSTITNVATATATGVAQVASPPATVTVVVPPPPAPTPQPRLVVNENYQLVYDADRDRRIGPGDLVQYTVVVSNRGTGPATGVVQTVQVSPVLEFIPRSLITTRGTVTHLPPSTIRAQIGTLAVGESASIAWVVRLGPKATSLSQLSIGTSLSATAPNPGTDEGAGSGTLATVPRLRMSVHGPRQLRGGELGTYRIVIRNLSRRDVRNLTLSDIMPPGLAAVAAAPRYRLVRGRPVWRIGIIRAGSSVTVVLRLRAARSARGLRRNTVILSGPTLPDVTLRTPLRILPPARPVRAPRVVG